MEIEVNNNEIALFSDCTLEFEVGTNLIYGCNNSGKTSLLAYVDYYCDKNIFDKEDYCYSLMLPTNRIRMDNGDSGKWENIQNRFEFKRKKDRINQYTIFEKRISIKDIVYGSHLKNIRGQLFSNIPIKSIIDRIINELFGIKYNKNEIYSDGIENVINIYLNIIWLALIHAKVSDLKSISNDKQIINLLETAKIIIGIDEIELYLHVSILDKFLQGVEKMFKNSILIYSTHSALVLSRVNAKSKYKINGPRIDKIDENLFYQSIDKINETNFDVCPWPEELTKAILCIEKVALGDKNTSSKNIKKYLQIVKKYNNIRDEYFDLISYVEGNY